MATLTRCQQGQSLQQMAIRQKKKAVKSVLVTPFQTHWPKLPDEDQQKILEDLKSLLLPIYHKKKKKKKKPKETDKTKRRLMQTQYVIGLNSVTRHLEKNLLSLVLVCDSAHPKYITRHIAELSAIRGCPAVLLKDLGLTLASSLKIRSCIIIGFKKPTDGKCVFKDFISSVEAPKIKVPFMTNYVAQHSNILAEGTANHPKVCKGNTSDDNSKPPLKLSVSNAESMDMCIDSSVTPSHNSGQISNTPVVNKDGFSRFYVRKSAKKPMKVSGQKAFDPSMNFILLGYDTDDDSNDDDDDDDDILKMMLCFRNQNSNIKNTKWEEIFSQKLMPDHLWNKFENVTKNDQDVKEQHANDEEKVLSKKKSNAKSKYNRGSLIEYKDTSIRRIKGNSERKGKKSKKDSRKTLKIGKVSKTGEKNK